SEGEFAARNRGLATEPRRLFAGAVKAPATAGCSRCVRMETRWTGTGTGPVPGRDGLPALCEA
ncbi:hypothetical protein, partial [Pantoea allii]